MPDAVWAEAAPTANTDPSAAVKVSRRLPMDVDALIGGGPELVALVPEQQPLPVPRPDAHGQS